MDKFWLGTVEKCDWCNRLWFGIVGEKMYDAKSQAGPWGNFCERCFNSNIGGKLGTGRGQEYTWQGLKAEAAGETVTEGRWLKTGG
jgi:hypothetical protein